MEDYKNSKRFTEEKTRIKVQLTGNGVPENQADTVADCFATADIFGVKTHGEKVLPAHIKKIQSGFYNLNPNFKVKKETAAFAVIDGDNAIGCVSAMHCVEYAIERVKQSGIYTVFSPSNNTFGAAFCYALKAAEQGYFAIVASNSPAQMTAMGGATKMLGTNPFAAVIPVADGQPVIIDMATSIVAKSKFKEYAESGKALPDGWALDKNGNPTNDPNAAINGFVLPMAGFKGYGIALLIDYIAGLLSGAAYLNHVGRFYSEEGDCMNVGFYIQVVDVKAVFGENYDKAIAKYVAEIRNGKSAEGKKVVLPGDDRYEYMKKLIGAENN